MYICATKTFYGKNMIMILSGKVGLKNLKFATGLVSSRDRALQGLSPPQWIYIGEINRGIQWSKLRQVKELKNVEV